MRADRLSRKIFVVLLLIAPCAFSTSAESIPDHPQIAIQAQVDKAAVDLGQPITLTITVAGQLSGAELKPPQFPKELPMVAQSRSTNVALQAGVVHRAVSVMFVLQPVEVGTFQLGPFEVQQGQETVHTEPIELTVKRPILPPGISSGGRITL